MSSFRNALCSLVAAGLFFALSTAHAADGKDLVLRGVLAVQNFVGPAMTSPDYDVNVIGISYIYRFQ